MCARKKSEVYTLLPPEWSALGEAFDKAWGAFREETRSCLPKDRTALVKGCPWLLKGLAPRHAETQLVCWFLLDRTAPETKKTLLRSLVETNIRDPRLAEMLLWMEHPRWGEYEIIEVRGNILVVKGPDGAEPLLVEAVTDITRKCGKGWTLTGALHRWGDGWRPNGIFTVSEPPEAIFARSGLIHNPDWLMGMMEGKMVARAESIVMRERVPLTAILNKYPSQWVDGICRNLGISITGKKRDKSKWISDLLNSPALKEVVKRLPEGSRKALAFVLGRGGSVPLGTLGSAFDFKVGIWWSEKPPTSLAGRLRALGLLVVGRVPGKGGRMAWTAMVPMELRGPLSEALGIGLAAFGRGKRKA